MKKFLLMTLFVIMVFNKVLAVVYTTVANGSPHVPLNFADAAAWDTGFSPPNPLPAGSSIVINHNINLTGTRTFNGNVTLNANLNSTKLITIGGGTFTVNSNGSITSTNGLSLTNNGYLVNNGNLNFGGDWNQNGNSYFTNNENITIGGDWNITKDGNNPSVNYGTITVDGQLDIQKNSYLSNEGVIQAGSIVIDKDNTIENNGTLYSEGDFWMKQNGEITGVGFIFAGGNVKIDDSTDATTQNICRPDGLTVPPLTGANQGQLEGNQNSFCGTPLPIKIFEITYINGKVNIKWSSDRPKSIDHFIIQKSRDGLFWVDIDIVLPNDINYYEYIDTNPHVNISYYRIIQVINGYKYYNSIGVIEFNNKEILLYPIPVTDVLIVEPEIRQGVFELFNLDGVLLLRVVFSEDVLHINLSEIESGLYYVIVTDGLGEKKVKKIIKN